MASSVAATRISPFVAVTLLLSIKLSASPRTSLYATSPDRFRVGIRQIPDIGEDVLDILRHLFPVRRVRGKIHRAEINRIRCSV